MAEELHISLGASRPQLYQELLPQIEAVISDESDLIANLANVAAMLKEAFGFLWVGFYRMLDDELVLGPFQGPLACTRIALGKGVCGTSAQQQQSILVPDVEQFPGHIACSSLSRSEVVIPLIHQEKTQLILDIDSEKLNDFSDIDLKSLEQIIQLLHQKHYA